jgi:hypothetical protein
LTIALQRNHRFALFLYTTQGVYGAFNAVLRERSRRGAQVRGQARAIRSCVVFALLVCTALTISATQFEAFRPFLWHLMAALKPLPDQVKNPPPLVICNGNIGI